jgi:anti-anti-sigma regulatory factor
MACRIDVLHEAGPRVVQVSGRLTGACVPDLLKVCSAVAGALHLDLDQLVSADHAGLGALRHLRASGARLDKVPPFIELLLDARSADRSD